LDSSSTCNVTLVEATANLWVHFVNDLELRTGIRNELDRFLNTYENYRQIFVLTRDHLLLNEDNWEKIYVAVLPDRSLGGTERLCRIKLVSLAEGEEEESNDKKIESEEADDNEKKLESGVDMKDMVGNRNDSVPV